MQKTQTNSQIGWLTAAAYDRFLVRSLKAKTDHNEIRTMCGVDAGKFYLGRRDSTLAFSMASLMLQTCMRATDVFFQMHERIPQGASKD